MGALNANLMIQKEKWQARYEEVVAFLNGDSFISLNDYITACIELLKLNPKKHSCVSVRGTRLK